VPPVTFTPAQRQRAANAALAAARRTDPAVARAFVETVARALDGAPRQRLERLIAENRIADALRVADQAWTTATAAWRTTLAQQLRDTLEAGAQAVLQNPPVLAGAFDVTHPAAVAWAAERSAQLVTRVTAETRAAIQARVATAIREGVAPRALATELRGLIGLTPRGGAAVRNFRDALTRLQAAPPGTSVDTNLARVSNRGLDPARVERLVERYRARLIAQRAEMIARTETLAAVNAGQRQAWDQAVVRGSVRGTEVERVWIVTDDERLCDECDALDGETAPLGGKFPGEGGEGPPLHPNAVLGAATFVPYGGLLEFVRARYRGPAIHVRAGHYATTIGPNHPMLTRRGFLAAAEVRIGDQVLYDHRQNGAMTRGDEAHLEQIPCLEQAFEAARSGGAHALVAGAGHDLHGDRVFCEGEVEIVRPARYLLPVWDLRGVEQARESVLMATYAETLLLARGRASLTSFERVALAASSDVGGADTRIATDDHRPASWLTVERVSRTWFEGWAYDASTQASLYCADGFVVSNCRCTEGLQRIAD
jgi:hypothetical protein